MMNALYAPRGIRCSSRHSGIVPTACQD